MAIAAQASAAQTETLIPQPILKAELTRKPKANSTPMINVNAAHRQIAYLERTLEDGTGNCVALSMDST
jgi:hypothetical protein